MRISDWSSDVCSSDLGGGCSRRDSGVRPECGIDFTEFDAIATDLDLVVGPSDERQGAVGSRSCHVAAAKQSSTGSAERVCHESRCGGGGPVAVSPCDSGGSYVDLTDRPGRYRSQGPVEEGTFRTHPGGYVTI